MEPIQRIAMIGFGEAGGILGHDLAASGRSVGMFDILLADARRREAMLAKAAGSNVRACDSPADAVRDADLVLSAVTASSAINAARETAPSLQSGQIYLDINSVSPDTKREIASIVESAGASFVEAAVMAAVPPQRLKVPMLLGGKKSADVAPLLQALGMNAKAVSDRIGVASAIKMCRSIVIKGLEALAVECMFTARRYEAEDAVLASLAATFPQMGWLDKLPDYLISRVAEHGRRRASELREVSQTVKAAGLEPLMTLAAAERQDWLVDEMVAAEIAFKSIDSFQWRELADALADHVKSHHA